jgi:hypothetical protein
MASVRPGTPRLLSSHFFYRLAGGAVSILDLPLPGALFAEVPSIEELIPDLFQRHPAAGGMLGPRDIETVDFRSPGYCLFASRLIE